VLDSEGKAKLKREHPTNQTESRWQQLNFFNHHYEAETA